MIIRTTTSQDLAALGAVLEGTKLFPPELLPEMFAGGDAAEIWLSCEVDGVAVGFCYAVPEELAEGTWNMLALAVLPSQQKQKCGTQIVAALEAMLRERQARIVIADTSGTEAFARVRRFYQKNGYAEEARVRDFWAAGDDKIVFWKALG